MMHIMDLNIYVAQFRNLTKMLICATTYLRLFIQRGLILEHGNWNAVFILILAVSIQLLDLF